MNCCVVILNQAKLAWSLPKKFLKMLKPFVDVEIFFGSYLLLSPLRSDVSENVNTVEGCFIAQIYVLISF